MPDDNFEKTMNALGRIHRRVNEIADLEARDVLVRGWASSGALMPEKMRLLEEADRLLAQAMAPAPAQKRQPATDAVSNAARVVRIATGEEADNMSPKKKQAAQSKKSASKKR